LKVKNLLAKGIKYFGKDANNKNQGGIKMRINNNMLAMNTHRQLGLANTAGAKSMEKLSSGFRINRAGDDAAGLAISEKMRGQIRGLNQASRNAQDGISLIQTTEGALNETHAILQRMRELAVQSSTDTNTAADRMNIQDEIDQLSEEITRIATTTEFNTMNLLDGTFKDKKFHIGANQGQEMEIKVGNMTSNALQIEGKKYGKELDEALAGLKLVSREEGTELKLAYAEATASGNFSEAYKVTESSGTVTVTFRKAVSGGSAAGTMTAGQLRDELQKLGFQFEVDENATAAFNAGAEVKNGDTAVSATKLDSTTEMVDKKYGIDISTQEKASQGITTINTALETVSKERSKLGAIQNRLEHTIKNLDTSAENLQASESRIRDVDMAKEMMEQTKQNILQQASTAMLAQSFQNPQTVLQLLR
jgi:flagellin